MLWLVLALSAAQTATPSPPAADAPVVAPQLSPDALPPLEDPGATVARPPPDRALRRVVFSSLGGIGGAFAGFGIAVGLTSCFGTCASRLDVSFATAALGSLLITGVDFTVHQILGGRGEIILAFLASMVTMAGAAALTSVIPLDQNSVQKPLVMTAIGALPAAVASALVLEATGGGRRGQAPW